MNELSKVKAFVTTYAKKQNLSGSVVSVLEDSNGYVAVYGSIKTPFGNTAFSVDRHVSKCSFFSPSNVENLIRFRKMKEIYTID